MKVIRRWKFYFKDENDDGFYYPDNDYEFIGNHEEARVKADELAKEVEDKLNCLILKVTFESQGVVK